MKEQLTLDRITLTPEEFAAVEATGVLAAQIVDEDFGTGYPHFAGGREGGLAYHNGHHTLFVADGSERMAEHLGLTRAEQMVARSAGQVHDLVQRKPRGVMERESAEWYAEQLRARRVPEAAVHAGSLAILGTEPLFEGNQLSQLVRQLVFPSKSAEQIAQSVASADLGELYAPEGPYVGHRLWQEIKGMPPSQQPPLEGLVSFQANQVALAEGYQFPHPAGEVVFGRLRGPVVGYQQQVLRQLEAGEITSWQQLLDQDLAFAAQHA